MQGDGRQWAEPRVSRRRADRAARLQKRGEGGQGHQDATHQRGPTAVQSALPAAHLLHHRLTAEAPSTAAAGYLCRRRSWRHSDASDQSFVSAIAELAMLKLTIFRQMNEVEGKRLLESSSGRSVLDL